MRTRPRLLRVAGPTMGTPALRPCKRNPMQIGCERRVLGGVNFKREPVWVPR